MNNRELKTNKDVLELFTILAKNQGMKPGKIKYGVFRTLENIRNRAETINKLKDELIKTYGEDQNGNGNFSVAPTMKTYAEFTEKFNDLLAQDASDLKVYKISKNVFDEEVEKLISESDMEIGDMFIIEDFLVDNEE